ncbi:hypothetical protein [Niabella beijingensis]|uniref:hypothetical protein n=1 Tax=Niabella beijingensis TaxID=2872700 RepID=UPI001CBCDA36|nr:hypothetical protein [Niabella beijingensis]MBZ4187682.1 hypothetical protein [Niabella beijingensis]
MSIPTYVINLKSRTDRKAHILKEFEGRDEFNVNIVEAHEHQVGAVGLWNSIIHIIRDLAKPDDNYVLICEDDHVFTENYSEKKLFEYIESARSMKADVLLGGVSWFEDGVQVSDEFFRMKNFSGTQFLIIFRKFFATLLDVSFSNHDCADYKMISLSSRIYFLYPFISIQKEFGYSDATAKNNGTGRVESLFWHSSKSARVLTNVRNAFKGCLLDIDTLLIDEGKYENFVLPVYVINLPERMERRKHIMKQFEGRSEFDVRLIDAMKRPVGALGLWESIRKVILLATERNEDVIIICEDDHEFTSDYSKEVLFKTIVQAHLQGCEYMSGGSGKFDVAVPLDNNRLWTNHCLSTQFIILYRRFFNKILEAPFDENVIGDIKLSGLTKDKMLLYPPVSTQRDFGYSDVTSLHNHHKGIVQNMFRKTFERLDGIMKMHFDYHQI